MCPTTSESFWCTLPFLPAEQMFSNLKRKTGSDQLRQLASYVAKTWISGLWKPADWSLFKQSVRTNNDIEGWPGRHNRLHRHARRGQLPLYLLHGSFTLQGEPDSETKILVRLFSTAKLRRYQRANSTVLCRRGVKAVLIYIIGFINKIMQ